MSDFTSNPPISDTMALEMLGRDAKLRWSHFVELAGQYGIPERAMTKTLDGLCRVVGDAQVRLPEIGLADKRVKQLVKETAVRLGHLA